MREFALYLIMAIKAGQLNKRITLQAKGKVPDDYGGVTVTWTDIATVWAALWAKSGIEKSLSMQETMTITHQIRIRYRSAFSQAWRIKFGNRFFNIISIKNPNEHGEMLDLMCKEVSG